MKIEPSPDSPFEIKIKSVDSDGLMDFDNQVGRLLESNLKQKMVMEVTAMGQVSQQKIDQTVSMKLVTNEDG